MIPEDRKELYAAAADAWGVSAQLTMLAEEAAELTVAALHCLRTAKDRKEARQELVSELADVRIMTEQIIYLFELEREVRAVEDFKLGRLHGRVQRENVK